MYHIQALRYVRFLRALLFDLNSVLIKGSGQQT
jgi:hypothetical protein